MKVNHKDFQSIDNEVIDNSMNTRGFLKNYHQEAANFNDSDQNLEVNIRENNKYHQIGNAYLQHEKKIEKDDFIAADRVLIGEDVIRLVKIA